MPDGMILKHELAREVRRVRASPDKPDL